MLRDCKNIRFASVCCTYLIHAKPDIIVGIIGEYGNSNQFTRFLESQQLAGEKVALAVVIGSLKTVSSRG